MAKPKDKPPVRPIDRVLEWSGRKSKVDLAEELEISPQALNNWIVRDIPPKEWARIAAHYGRSVEILVGKAEDDASLSAMMEFWDVLLPDSKADILRHAKYVRTIQNPVPDPKPAKPVKP